MTLEMLLEDRYQWQNNTLERIGNQLSHKSEHFEISKRDCEQGTMGAVILKDRIDAMISDYDKYAKQQLASIEEKMQELQQQMNAMEEKIAEKEHQLPDCESMLAEHKEEVTVYRFVRDTDIHFSIKEYKNMFIKYMDSLDGRKMKEAAKKLARICENQLQKYISDTLQHPISVYIGMESCEEIYQSIVDEIPVEAEFDRILSTSGWISMFDKVYRIKCSFQIEDLFFRLERKLNSIYKTKKTEYLRQNREIKEEYDRYSQLKMDCKREIQQCREQIEKLSEAMKDELEAKKTLVENSQKEQVCLADYMEILTQEFNKQKDSLLVQLEGDLSPDEKLNVLLFISLLEKDYKNISNYEGSE